MRKWTYLVAALLMSGATATFTSCIDTEEPAGITDLRGAKAELLRAKAAYQTALANTEQANADFRQVQVEREKIELEIDKLRQEMIAAENQWKMDSLQAKRDTLAASLEIKLVEMQQRKAQADYNLQEALAKIDAALITMKDNIYGEKIAYYRVLLAGGTYYTEEGTGIPVASSNAALAQLESAESELIRKQIQMTKFVSESATMEAELTAEVAEKKAVLEIQQGLLDDLKEIEQAEDLPALNAQLAAKYNELAALDTKEDEKIKEVEDLRNNVTVSKDILDLEAQLNTRDEYVLAKADVKSETMYEDLMIYLTSYSSAAGASFSQDAEGNWVMDEDVTFDVLAFQYKANVINSIRYYVGSYMSAYQNAYRGVTGDWSVSTSEMFNVDGSLKDTYRAKVDNQYDRWAIDAAARKATAETDLAAWVKAYENYMTALKNYKNYQGEEVWQAATDAINAYIALEPAKQDLTAANALRKTIYDYAVLREAADGHVVDYWDYTIGNRESFVEKYKDAIPAAASGATTNADLDFFNSIVGSISLGTQQLALNYWGTVSETNTLGIYLAATEKVFGETGDINTIVQPEAYQDGDATKYRMPADYVPTGGSYALYLADADVDDIITDIDNWAALYKILYDDANAVTAEIADINKQITDLRTKSLDELKALWAAEVELYLIKGTNSNYGNPFTNGNPYSTYWTNADIETEYSVLWDEITLLQSAINAGSFSYVAYDEINGYYVTAGRLDAAIANQESAVEQAADAVEQAQVLLDLFVEHGYTGTYGGTASESNCEAILQKAIDKQTEIVAFKQAEVDRLKAVLEDLLEAAAAE